MILIIREVIEVYFFNTLVPKKLIIKKTGIFFPVQFFC